MSDGGDSPKAAEAPAAAAAPAPGEPMDINTAIQLVLKKALAHDGLARGLHEACRSVGAPAAADDGAGWPVAILCVLWLVVGKDTLFQSALRDPAEGLQVVQGLQRGAVAIERGQAQLCILADDCNQPDYKKLIEALCAEQSVNLIAVPDPKTLGQWAGLCKIDSEGEARKVVGCSCAVVTDYGEETEGLAVLQEYLKSR
ncbi:hypothetical protein N2152v2_008348 [Parachlorella kessleri]